MILTIAVVLVVVVVAGAYALSTLGGKSNPLLGKAVDSSVYQPLYTVATTSYGSANTTLLGDVKAGSGTAFATSSKPLVVYIGAEYCPYCAFQRWPLVVALMRFGNFTDLRYMQSAGSPEVFPDTYTFSFVGSTYTSPYLTFNPYELQDRSYSTITSLPSNYSGVFSGFGGGYPFIDVNNQYVVTSAFYFPSLLVGNWTQIVQQIQTNTQVGDQIKQSANVITALICSADGKRPTNVCTNSAISALYTGVSAVDYSPSSPSTILANGSPISMATMWANVQYGQMAWSRNTSAKIR